MRNGGAMPRNILDRPVMTEFRLLGCVHPGLLGRVSFPAMKSLLALSIASVALVSGGAADAEPSTDSNWPQFRGPRASGVQRGFALPTRWDVESRENVAWTAAVPGLGHASPVVWDDRVYVATAVSRDAAELRVGLYGDVTSSRDVGSQQWHLLAFDLGTGAELWNIVAHEAIPRVKRHPKASHCNSTPATDGRHLVAILGSEGLFCFDMDGRPLWRKDLGPMDSGFFTMPEAQWGFASSPVIHRDRVVVLCDVQTNSFIAAFDLTDGREAWRTSRADVPTWGTPTVVEHGAETQIVVNGWHHTGGYDVVTGRELWRVSGGGDIPVPTPVAFNDVVIQTSAHGAFRPLRAIRLAARGDITPENPGATNASIAWAHPRQGSYMQTPIVVGELGWACTDNGVLTCFDPRTGEIHYSERLPSGQGYTASPVSDGRHLYFASEPGKVAVVPVSREFSIAATNELGDTCMATPALARGRLLFRTRGSLIAVGTP